MKFLNQTFFVHRKPKNCRTSQLTSQLTNALAVILPLFFCISLVFAHRAFAQTDQLTIQQRILFINQVRGEECCDPGNVRNLQLQLNTFQANSIPANFALRYDAVINPQYTALLKKYITTQPTNRQLTTEQLGVFLEITPDLAAASGVEYAGAQQPTDQLTSQLAHQQTAWYQAQHAYTIGYSLDDRKKIIDTVFAAFKKQFGNYPTFTVGWIVDTPTINYIREKYGVTIHQITREQFGTDSYTLDGGPFHYPYLASNNWVFQPDATAQQPNNSTTLILRQTISDPLFNYGDPTSAFTSQPNDYSRDGKNIEYFKKLLLQSLTQPSSQPPTDQLTTDQPINQYSIAILGLENSMGDEYQQAYVKQIAYVTELAKKTSLKVQSVTDFNREFREKWSSQPMTVIQGTDLINDTRNETIWINTPNYRVRILKNNDQVSITDLRLYNSDWLDPYTEYTAQNLGYWIVPFLIDGSRFYQPTTDQLSNRQTVIKDWLKEQILPEYKYRPPQVLEIKNDLATQPTQLTFPKLSKQDSDIRVQRLADDTVQLSYRDGNEQLITLTFSNDHFELSSTDQLTTDELITQLTTDQLPFIQTKKNGQETTIAWQAHGDTPFLELKIDCTKTDKQSTTCSFLPTTHATNDQFQSVRNQYYPFLFPEIIARALDNQETILYAHNKFAIAGRNPIRFVLIPKDEQGYATTQSVQPTVTVDPPVTDVIVQNQQGDGIIFIDIVDNRVGKYTVTVSVDDQIEKTETVYFAPDCREEEWQCLKRPDQAAWFLLSNFYAKLRTI